MPVNWLTDADRARLDRFPASISEADLISFFTLWRRRTTGRSASTLRTAFSRFYSR